MMEKIKIICFLLCILTFLGWVLNPILKDFFNQKIIKRKYEKHKKRIINNLVVLVKSSERDYSKINLFLKSGEILATVPVGCFVKVIKGWSSFTQYGYSNLLEVVLSSDEHGDCKKNILTEPFLITQDLAHNEDFFQK